jgi:ubiquinone/menaquinone biosynthesis C-methylase UbiE
MEQKTKNVEWQEAQSQEIMFWKSLKLSNTSGEVAHSVRQYRRCIELFGVKLAKTCKVLDVGSGCYGGFAVAYPDVNAVSVDPLIGKVKLSFPDKSNPVCGIAEDLAFASGSIDVVVSVNALDHSADPERMLLEIKRVMKEGGEFILMANFVSQKLHVIHRVLFKSKLRKATVAVVSLRYISRLTNEVASKLTRVFLGKFEVLNDGVLHPVYFTESELFKLLEASGFVIKKYLVLIPDDFYKTDLFVHCKVS